MRSEKSICAPPRLSEVFPTSPLKQFQCSSDWQWPSLVLSRKIVERFLFPHLSPPGDQWCEVLGFVPAVSVSSFSTLQIFRGASRLWELLCPPFYLLGRFVSLRHVEGSTPTGNFEGECRPSTQSSLGFPFHVSLSVAISLNLWGWWHTWSGCHLFPNASFLPSFHHSNPLSSPTLSTSPGNPTLLISRPLTSLMDMMENTEP